MRRKLSLFVMVVVAGLIFGACASGKPAMESANAPVTAAPAPQGAKGASQNAPAQPGSTQAIPADRKIILNASFDIRVKDADETINKLDQTVRAAGGYVQDAKQNGTKQQGRTINMTVRIPANQYGAIKDFVRGLGEVTQQREWTEDVTDQYVDLDERIRSKEVHLQQLQKLYAQGGTIKDMMEVEAEIDRVQADLESMKGRMRVLSNRIDLSTFTINLYEPGVPAPIAPPKTVWERMTRGFVSSWNGVVNFTGDLVVFLVSALPVLLFLALIGGAIYLIIRFAQRRMPKRPAGPPPMQYPQYGPVPQQPQPPVQQQPPHDQQPKQ
ncbi:MAG TPA: DUF4349 domain-containing protein [Symbiobacteriaceae bacterium]|jgi:hypothetical protein|nr:DUF4349 domain-containing protein [Symbiobacteriaceae bacterium]